MLKKHRLPILRASQNPYAKNGSRFLPQRADGSGTHTLESVKSVDGSAATKKEILCSHLNANSIGDYYDIQPLCRLARNKVKSALETPWYPDDFLHLLTTACTTRKTGDDRFHWQLGHIAAQHLEDLAGFQDLDGLDLPAAVAMSVVVSSVERIQSLENKVRDQAMAIISLETTKKDLETRVRNAHDAHKTLATHRECRNSTCTETFPCYIEQDGNTYNLRCSRCRCRH